MADDRTVFKRCMEQKCASIHAEFGRFARAVCLNDFLQDTFDVPRSPKEISVRALDQLCEGDKRMNDQVVCLGVLSFLDETLGPPKEDPDQYQRLKDLAALLTGPGTSTQFERWVEAWYE